MIDTVLKIVSILSAVMNIITKAVEMVHTKDKDQKSNRTPH